MLLFGIFYIFILIHYTIPYTSHPVSACALYTHTPIPLYIYTPLPVPIIPMNTLTHTHLYTPVYTSYTTIGGRDRGRYIPEAQGGRGQSR